MILLENCLHVMINIPVCIFHDMGKCLGLLVIHHLHAELPEYLYQYVTCTTKS